jgi:hypothetical protein
LTNRPISKSLVFLNNVSISLLIVKSAAITSTFTSYLEMSFFPMSRNFFSFRATRTMLRPWDAICVAYSFPIPEEAPVTRAQSPYLSLNAFFFVYLSCIYNINIKFFILIFALRI